MKRLIQSKNTYLILVTELIIFLFIAGSINTIHASNYFKSISLNNLSVRDTSQLKILPAADLIYSYVPLLKGKRIAVVANQTSVIGTGSQEIEKKYTHLIDTLLSHDIHIEKVFSPEHGFRGRNDAGEKVADDKDLKTGLQIISLYGKNKKPSADQLKDIDLVLFDIQDVGVRFYTYISTLSLVMEACAESGIALLVLDRPNPNGHYIDGPVLEKQYSSFLGMHEIPLVYGMTIGEYAQMVNGEGWLKDAIQCDLKVIQSLNYTHQSRYRIPVRPSPNLPNDLSINLYPSLGFFEGTIINAGRGTNFQFQRYGAPFFTKTDLVYIPEPNFGSKQPKFKGQVCNGIDLRNESRQAEVNLTWLIDAYQRTPKDEEFFGETFTSHAGNTKLRKQIESGMNSLEIRNTWKPQIDQFKLIRKKYLLYP